MIEMEIQGRVGILTLNRLKAYNALSVEMILSLLNTLKAWQHDKNVQAVVIRSASNDVFCAGGDIKALYHYREEPVEQLMVFFEHEYQLDYLLQVYPKPVISLLNGATMGGGVGIGMHNRFAIAGENIVFAMPETAIGLFPDIGSSHLLNRLPNAWRNSVGVFGTRLFLNELLAFELVHAHIPTAAWDGFLKELIATNWTQDPFKDVEYLITKFKQTVAAYQEPCEEFWRFDADSFVQLMKNIDEAKTDYFYSLKVAMTKLCPLSMYVTFEKLKLSHGMDLENCLQLDYQLLYHFMSQPDFFEGVRALLIDKDKHPHWSYPDWESIPYSVLQSYFIAKADLKLNLSLV
jgi:enoyl-CoA hydratase